MYKLSFIVLLALIIAGCQSTQDGFAGSHPEQRTQELTMNSIWFIDHSLNRTEVTRGLRGPVARDTVKVTVERSGIRDSDAGNMEVWALLRNRTDYDLQVEGKASFFDAGQAPLSDETMWRRVFLPANGTAMYNEQSIHMDANYFLLELREGR